MNDDKTWTLGRLAKIGLSAAAVPTLLLGLVALETDTASSTADDSELVKHLSDANRNKPQPDNDKGPDDDKDDENPVNDGKNKDVDKKEDKKDSDFDNPVNGGPNKPDVDKKERDPSGVLP